MGNPEPEWVQRLIKACKPCIPKEFVGRVELNIFKGGFTNVTVLQSYKEATEQ